MRNISEIVNRFIVTCPELSHREADIIEHMEFNLDRMEKVVELHEFWCIRCVDNFVYDKATGLVFLNFDMGCHQLFMAGLMGLLDNIPHSKWESIDSRGKMADKYIANGHGILLSSMGNEEIMVSTEFVYSSIEWKEFKHYQKFKLKPIEG